MQSSCGLPLVNSSGVRSIAVHDGFAMLNDAGFKCPKLLASHLSDGFGTWYGLLLLRRRKIK